MNNIFTRFSMPVVVLAGLSMAISACAPVDKKSDPLKSPQASGEMDDITSLSYVRVAQRFEMTGDLTGALHFYNQALQKDPNSLDAYEGIARAYVQGGAIEQAVLVYERIVELSPQREGATVALAKLYIEQSRFAEALKLVETQLILGTTDISLFNIKGIALDLLGRHDDAQLAYADGLDKAPDDPDVLTNMALSFALSDMPETAIGLLMGLATVEGELGVSARSNLAVIHAMIGDVTSAMAMAGTLYSGVDLPEMEIFYTAISRR